MRSAKVSVDDVHEILDRAAAQAVAPDAREPGRRVGVCGREHLLGRAADHDLAAQRLEPGELEVPEALLSPALRELA
jgi:hypothetical protein